MKRKASWVGGWLLAIMLGWTGALAQSGRPAGRGSEPFDQLAAVVNNEVITQSDLIWLLACNPQVTVPNVETPQLQQILNLRIDQLLLSQEAQRLPTLTISDAEVKAAERSIVARFPSEMIFRQRMESVGMTAAVLTRIASDMVRLEKYTNFRFRSFVIVTDEEVNTFYQEVYRPRAKAQNVVTPESPSEEDHKKIEQILLEKRVTEEMDRALSTARTRAEIIPLASYAKAVIKE